MIANPHSVLFCCDYNAVRSPMAEGIMKKYYGTRIFVQSAGVKSDLEIDGFTVAVCAEIGVRLERHRVVGVETAVDAERLVIDRLLEPVVPPQTNNRSTQCGWFGAFALDAAKPVPG